jgi:oligoribonuclease NrnB/cAMP/cGMP phosphodiesterase (DHH superfamily)
MKQRPLVVYHDSCDDGFCAAWAAWRKFREGADYLPSFYGAPAPEVTGRTVFVLDFSYPRADIKRLISSENRVILLDHHKSAMQDLNHDLDEFGIAGVNFRFEFDMERSGAMIAWQHFFPNVPAPLLVRYVQDRDLWHRILPDVDEFTMGLRSYPRNFEFWERIDTDQLIEEGAPILRFVRRHVDQLVDHAYPWKIDKHVVPVANSPYAFAGDVAARLSESAAFGAAYYDTLNQRVFTLRSYGPHGVDVSEIARYYGGGGHTRAAGFRLARGAMP